MSTWSKIQEKVYSEVSEATNNVQLDTPKIRILKNEINSSDQLKILDLGCNDGGISYMLAKNGHIVYGLDLSGAIEVAKKYAYPNLNL